MRNIMSRVRKCFNWQAKSLQVLGRQKLYLSMIESYEEVIEIRQSLVDSCLAEMTFKDHLFGEKKKELARQKQELAEAQATREKHIQTFRELKEEFQRLEAQEPADRMGDLMEIAAEDPANLRELSYMNARLCFISTEAELMDLDSTLGNIAFELENESTYGGVDEEEVEKYYTKAMGLAKECGPYLETFEAEMEELGIEWTKGEFLEDPYTMDVSRLYSVKKAQLDVQTAQTTMEEIIDRLMDEFE